MLISLNQVNKSFGSKTVLKNVSLQLNPGEKIGLIGRNGAGKTTLIRMIAGSLEPDDGHIVKQPQVQIGLVEQMTHVDTEMSVFEAALSVFDRMEALAEEIANLEAQIESKSHHSELNCLLDRYGQLQTQWEMEGGYSYEARTKAVLSGLGFEERELTKHTPTLSGGELNRLNLAKLLLSNPNLLLLDEPTNHLDISAVRWLEEFLKEYPHAFLVISHDRYFLDATVNKIVEIAEGRIEEYPGNYSAYILEREKRWELRRKAYEQQQSLVARTEEFIRRNLAGQKTKQAKSRRKMLEKLERLEPAGPNKAQARFRFHLASQSGDLVLKLKNVAVGYGEALASNINFSVYRGKNIGIVGPNGSGKSTLLRTILSMQRPLKGEIQVGQKVQMAYYDQQLSTLNSRLTVLEEMRTISPLATDQTLRGYLARFLFFGDDVFAQTSSLSGGEKSRLALAKLIFSRSNTLILDEPTNHLDIPSCEALETALLEFPGTLIIVSHDRYLLNKLADRILLLDGNGNCALFEGIYEEFESTKNEGKQPASVQDLAHKEPHRALRVKSGLNERKLSKNELSKLKSRCEFLEQEIQRVERLIESSANQLSDPRLAREFAQLKELSNCHEDLKAQLGELYIEWEKSLQLLESSESTSS